MQNGKNGLLVKSLGSQALELGLGHVTCSTGNDNDGSTTRIILSGMLDCNSVKS